MLVSLTIVAALVSPIVTSAAPADQKKGERTDVYQVPIGTVIAAEGLHRTSASPLVSQSS